MASSGGGTDARHTEGEVLADISNAVVRLMREAVGKGPTKCKTHWAGPDTILVILGGGYLEAEQTLYDAGHRDDVSRNRRVLQNVLEERLRGLIEERVGRSVVAFLSAQHQDPDIQVEVFLLEPVEPAGA